MKRTGFQLLVASSLLWAASSIAATRPHYGGTLHLQMQTAPVSLDPSASSQAGGVESRSLSALIFDTLVSLSEQGKPEPALASSWQAEPGYQRWRFLLRGGVAFGDGSQVTVDVVASSLRKANPTWKVFSEGDAVVVERDFPAPDLPAELALPRNSVVKRDGGKIFGTGPFAVSQWDPGKKLVLVARDEYWCGRAFLDTIEIEMGKSLHEQVISFDLGKAQVIEIAPEQAHRAMAEGRHVESSAPLELTALVFSHNSQSPDDGRQRQALTLSIDRELLNTVVLQGDGEPAGGLLPNWMTGYSFLFPASINLALARQVRSEIPHTTAWTLGYDPADSLSRVIAERIVLNARDAGLGIQVTSATGADLRLVRIPLASLDAQIALSDLATRFDLPQPVASAGSIDSLYGAENKLLQAQRVIPLLHLRTANAVSNTVKSWRAQRDGSWHLSNVWLAAERP